MEKEIQEKLTEALQKVWEERQSLPNQYVVAYFRKKDESRIGYHCSSFCQFTQDVIEGKRYSGENPYPQLETIFRNLTSVLEKEHTGLFSGISNGVRESFEGLKIEDIYIDAIYLSDDMPKQECRYSIIDVKNLEDGKENN